MEEFANRVEELLSRSNTAITDYLLAKISFALNICRLAQHHLGHEQSEQLEKASTIYHEVDEFSHRRSAVLSRELIEAMHRLRRELQRFGFGAQPELPEKSNVVAFHKNQK
jgi:hypothetical protein